MSFFQHANVPKQISLDFVEMHQWFRVSWNDVNVRPELNFTHLEDRNSLKTDVNHQISKKICLNVSNAQLKKGCHLLTIYTHAFSGLTYCKHSIFQPVFCISLSQIAQ